MNERIKQLAKQCYVTGPMARDGWPEYTKFDEQKFADLIVQECSELTLDYVDDNYYRGWIDYRDAIRNHFGVEE